MMKLYLFLFFFFFFLYLFCGDPWHILFRIKLIIKNYFSEEDSPFNIAIFRIILFFFVLTSFHEDRIIWFSQLPSDLKFPPVGMNFILSVIPITPSLVHQVMILFIAVSFLAMIGLFARTASFLAAISGIYVLGIPQFYGKVDHYHHLIWIMLILAASRCSDVMSIDAVWKAFREADRGQQPKNQHSIVYAMPLRFIWLLMGMIYFFPGLMKLMVSQGHWAWSDNLKYLLYARWFELGGWLPFFRLDQHPLLYKMCASAIILFELSFIFLMFFPVLRYVAAIWGIVFHRVNGIFLQLGFQYLQICYLSFINWAALFAQIGKWVFKEPYHVHLTGKSKSFHRLIAVLTKFDIFGQLTVSDQVMLLKKPLIDQKMLKFTGISLLLINSVFGFKEIMSGWPFACYPTFAERMFEARTETVTLYGVKESKEVLIDTNFFKQRMVLSKYTGMVQSILAIQDENQRKSKLKVLVSVMKAEGINLRSYAKIRFYKTVYSTEPGKANDPAISRELLEEISV